MSSKYKIVDHQALHFVTFATVQWVDALSRPDYKDIVMESLRYCINKKGLRLFAYVIMNNHVHLICSANEGYDLSGILRDLKKYTSKRIIKSIESNPRESRKNWMLWIFREAGKSNSNNKTYQFWQQDNHPIELSTNDMIDQRLDYIHRNPIVEGIVTEVEHYKYSSAIDYAGIKGLLEIEIIE